MTDPYHTLAFERVGSRSGNLPGVFMKRILFLQFTALCLLVLSVPSLIAQSSGTSGLTGIVKDPSGASVPNVTVTLTSTRRHRRARLPPAPMDLKVHIVAPRQLQS